MGPVICFPQRNGPNEEEIEEGVAVFSCAGTLNLSRETLQQNRILSLVKTNIVQVCLVMRAVTADEKCADKFKRSICHHSFLIIFIIHAVGNIHVFKGPDDFNGYGYFYVRLYWTGFGLPANIVEEYVPLSILRCSWRTWDQKLAMVMTPGLSALNLALTGLMLRTFMTIHLFQFRFGDTDKFEVDMQHCYSCSSGLAL